MPNQKNFWVERGKMSWRRNKMQDIFFIHDPTWRFPESSWSCSGWRAFYQWDFSWTVYIPWTTDNSNWAFVLNAKHHSRCFICTNSISLPYNQRWSYSYYPHFKDETSKARSLPEVTHLLTREAGFISDLLRLQNPRSTTTILWWSHYMKIPESFK